MYNMELQFTTEVWIPLDTAMADMLEQMDMPVPGVAKTITTTVEIKNATAIPVEENLRKMAEVLTDNVRETLKKEKVRVKNTVFAGYKKIQEI